MDRAIQCRITLANQLGLVPLLALASCLSQPAGTPQDADVPAADESTAVPTLDTDTDDDIHPAGPIILSLATSVTRLTEGDSVRISAIVTDPNGIDDLIGGELTSSSGASYGVFSTSAQEGAYELVVSWGELDRVDKIEFTQETDRDLVARFYDQAGHVAQQVVNLTLWCEEGTACDGACSDLALDVNNCGSCGHDCVGVFGFDEACYSGSCLVSTDCVADVDLSCDEICVAEGFSACFDLDGAGVVYTDASCAGTNESANITTCDTPVRRAWLYSPAQSAECLCLE